MTLHIRHDGRSFDVDLLDLRANATDEEIKQTAARFLEIDVARLRESVVERTREAVIVRPAAVYG